ncbi:hypothetical protein ACFRKD_32280 [Streptomyces niveus]|uniref:hypothetical protein n=1 Tax=Streptomyces niveus TaxID=193462 RepID=UPI0036A23A2C
MTNKKNTVAAAKAAINRDAGSKPTPAPPVTQGWLSDRYVQNKETSKFGDHPDDVVDE